MRFSVRVLLAACGVAAAFTALTVGPAQADTTAVPCPESVSRGVIPSGIDLVIFDKDKKTLCFSGQSDRAMKVDIYGVTQIYKHSDVKSVTLMVERNLGDVRSAWERIQLDADKPGHWFLGAPAHRIDSIHIRK